MNGAAALPAAVTSHFKGMLERFTKRFPWSSKKAARADSIRMLASMLGGLVLARAVDDAALSDEILREVRAGLDRMGADKN